ncbi:hypothetical protein ACQEWB_44055 [Streptomyces sp. CA-249302]|uniref:hypothetical protein n=1 Tax=Streptomyces sp. CA-249302 TaxID=3240058 RepID=UPI003D8C09C9
MSPLVTRGLLLPSVICAALVFGPVGTAAATVDVYRGAADPVSSQSSVPGSGTAAEAEDIGLWLDEMKDEMRDDVHVHGTDALAPLLGVLTDLTERGSGPLGVREAAEYRKAVEAAYTSLQRGVAERAGGTNRAAAPAADPVGDAVAQLQSVVADLLKALTSLDLGGVLGAVTGLLSPVLSIVTGLLGGLPVPSLPALPAPGSPAAP